jgi:hypothetical protein
MNSQPCFKRGRWIRRTLLAFSMLIGLVAGTVAGQSLTLGSKPEVLDSDLNSSVPTPVTQASFSITSGESRAFGPGPLTSPLGHTYFYFWSCQEGSLAGLNGENSHVRYTAPLVAAPTTDHLYVWVGSSGGKSTEGVIEVTVLPAGSTLPPIQGQLTASYNSANANFALGYQLPASATRAWILASLDGANWNQVYAVDPCDERKPERKSHGHSSGERGGHAGLLQTAGPGRGIGTAGRSGCAGRLYADTCRAQEHGNCRTPRIS